MKQIFTYVKAAQFFPKYCPEITNWKHKLRKIDGNKQPIDFSTEDRKQIREGLKRLWADLKKQK